jgi:hypothetical protein
VHIIDGRVNQRTAARSAGRDDHRLSAPLIKDAAHHGYVDLRLTSALQLRRALSLL